MNTVCLDRLGKNIKNSILFFHLVSSCRQFGDFEALSHSIVQVDFDLLVFLPMDLYLLDYSLITEKHPQFCKNLRNSSLGNRKIDLRPWEVSQGKQVLLQKVIPGEELHY